MAYDGFHDHIWDEHKWEAYLDEIERKSDYLRKIIAPEHSGSLPRWLILLQESADELEAVDAYIEEELQIEEAYFPDEDEDDWEDDEFDEDLDGFFYDEFEEDSPFEDSEDFDAGEEWKEFSEEYAMSDYGSLENVEVYNEARELAAFVLHWAEGIHPDAHTPEYNGFIGNVLKIGAKLAGGYSFGFEVDYLGGNIAYTKKALYSANQALVLLQDSLRPLPLMDRTTYLNLHERLFELRNSIGVYVQVLRERFHEEL